MDKMRNFLGVPIYEDCNPSGVQITVSDLLHYKAKGLQKFRADITQEVKYYNSFKKCNNFKLITLYYRLYGSTKYELKKVRK